MGRAQKGCHYGTCLTCARRRRLWRERVPGDRHQWTCSQGHTWIVLMSTLARVNEVTLNIITPGIVEQYFTDSPLIEYLKRRS